MRKICIIWLLQIAVMVVIGEECADCPSIPKHYEEMECEPIKEESDCCIRSFKCPNIKTRDANKCYFKNETYEVRENLKKEQLIGTCSGTCFCREGEEKPAEFVCAHIDCPEYFQGHDPSRKCVRQYDREHCCAINTICDEEMEKLSTCEFEGEQYKEGQKMYPKDLCYSCFCTKNFNSSMTVEENPDCYKIDCGISLRYSGRLHEGCVPIYYKNDNCCPIGWKCPEEEHKKLNNDFVKRNDSQPTCKFGEYELNIGEILTLDKEDKNCHECFCKVPPMIHCIEKC